MTPRLVIVGAGPIGLEAAVRGEARGWEVTVLEAEEPGAHLRRWGGIRFFTPLALNLSPLARARLGPLPFDGILAGTEFADAVLRPLAATLASPVRTRHRVVGISRRRTGRYELAGLPARTERPFELLVESPAGELRLEADGVIDATGTFGLPRWTGRSGMPALGERGASEIYRWPMPILSDPDRWTSARVVVVGNGASAATMIDGLATLRAEGGGAVSWVTPDDRSRPVDEVPGDPLPDRAGLYARVNNLAARPPSWLRIHRRAAVTALGSAGGAGWVEVAGRSGVELIPYDRLLSMVGYRPSPGILAETTVALDPVWEGGAALARALGGTRDCLAKLDLKVEDLASGEPDLFLVGQRGYGSRSSFLLQAGQAQLDLIFGAWALRRRGAGRGGLAAGPPEPR